MSTFERQLSKIKEIIEVLENGNLPLDESLTKFEEGTNLIKNCYEKLEEVKKNIKVIVDSDSEELNYKDFTFDGEEE